MNLDEWKKQGIDMLDDLEDRLSLAQEELDVKIENHNKEKAEYRIEISALKKDIVKLKSDLGIKKDKPKIKEEILAYLTGSPRDKEATVTHVLNVEKGSTERGVRSVLTRLENEGAILYDDASRDYNLTAPSSQ